MSASRSLALVVWVGAVVAWLVVSRLRGVGPIDAAGSLRGLLADNWWGPVLYVVIYTLRPIVLFPASILTVLGGLAAGALGLRFGPFLAGSFLGTIAGTVAFHEPVTPEVPT